MGDAMAAAANKARTQLFANIVRCLSVKLKIERWPIRCQVRDEEPVEDLTGCA
jgi:hypothetical protein